MRLTARFDRWSMLWLDIVALAAHARVSETRMNTHVSHACDGRKNVATFLFDTHPFFMRPGPNLARVRAFLETIPEMERVRFPRAAS
jgi:hypothetical protein